MYSLKWDTTEIFIEGDYEWITLTYGELPVALDGIQGVSLQNRIFMTGKARA